MSDLVLWYRECVRQKGEPGVVEWEWLALPLKRRLVRLGRLQYQPRTLERETTVRGVLYPAGTGVLEVHIPAGDALLPCGADDSLRRAMAFFPPERRALLHCHSWLLAPELRELVDANVDELRKQGKTELPKYEYPDEVVTAAIMGRWSKYGVKFEVRRTDCLPISELDAQKEGGQSIYGNGLLLSERAAAERAAAERAAAERAAAERAAAQRFALSDREREIVRSLGERHE